MDEKLAAYEALVREWAQRLNLVALGDLDRFEERHIRDCLRVSDLARGLPSGPAVDVGSGAGLPGIPLAISDPDRPWRLLEPRGKRAAFLEEVVRRLELANCEVISMTAQEGGQDARLSQAHVLATARAVAPPAQAFGLLGPLLTENGVAILFVAEGATLPAGAVEIMPGVAKMTMFPGKPGWRPS